MGLFVNSAFDSGNIEVRRLLTCSIVAVGADQVIYLA